MNGYRNGDSNSASAAPLHPAHTPSTPAAAVPAVAHHTNHRVLSTGAKAGIGTGVGGGVLVLLGVVIAFIWRNRNRNRNRPQPVPQDMPGHPVRKTRELHGWSIKASLTRTRIIISNPTTTPRFPRQRLTTLIQRIQCTVTSCLRERTRPSCHEIDNLPLKVYIVSG